MALYNTTTRKEFEEKVIKSDKIVLVDFWAQWCPPCRMMAPILEELAKAMDKEIDIVKVDTEASRENMELASEYQVRSIPNMNVFKAGEVVETIIGAVPREELESYLKKHI